MIAGAAAKAADVSTYYACMDASDIPILEQTGLPATRLGEAVSALGPDDADIPDSPQDPPTPGWTTFMAQQRTITDADWSCRQNVYNEHIMDLAPLIATFADAHQAEIDEAQSQWASIEQHAADLGFDGQSGPVGG
jgi:hypothetical protein